MTLRPHSKAAIVRASSLKIAKWVMPADARLTKHAKANDYIIMLKPRLVVGSR
jgi:hypothetical protein